MANPSNHAPSGHGLSAMLRAISADPQQFVIELQGFLRESDPLEALILWLGSVRCAAGLEDKEAVLRWLHADIAALDKVLNQLVNAVLHHERFQRLEATWQGLRFLVSQIPPNSSVKVRVLNVHWNELVRDAQRAIEFDQSQLFRKIYEDEFGTPGGQPFGLLLCDHAVQHRVTLDYPVDDLRALKYISEVAAAAFAPVITSVAPELFGVDRFAELDRPVDLQKIFTQAEYMQWRSLRDSEDARFVGMTMPQVLMRRPYQRCTSRSDGFMFEEDVRNPNGQDYLWGNAVYAYGSVVMRAFAQSGWFEDIVGVTGHGNRGGLVTELTVDAFDTDRSDTVTKMLTDVTISDECERNFTEAGFIPLCHCRHTQVATFYSSQSIQRPAAYDRPGPTRNAQLSSRLNLMLCVSRFAHYIKVIARDHLGSYASADQLETYLHKWIHQYVSADMNAPPNVRLKFPLRSAKVQVRNMAGKPGTFLCTVHLQPHLHGDSSTSSMKFVTKLTAVRQSALELAA